MYRTCCSRARATSIGTRDRCVSSQALNASLTSRVIATGMGQILTYRAIASATSSASHRRWVLRHDAVRHIVLRHMEFAGAIREAKKGTAELVVLALLEDQPRH